MKDCPDPQMPHRTAAFQPQRVLRGGALVGALPKKGPGISKDGATDPDHEKVPIKGSRIWGTGSSVPACQKLHSGHDSSGT